MASQPTLYDRKHFLSIRLTHAQKQRLKTKARQARCHTLSDYVLRVALGELKAR